MGAGGRSSKLRWLAVLVVALGCDPAADTDAGAVDAGFDAASSVDSGPAPEPALTITPELQDFGNSECATEEATFTVTNSGAGSSGALSAAISGGDATSFEIGADDCEGVTLAPSATCTIGVTFNPTDTGTANATLTVSDGGASANATLEGTGTSSARIRISPTPRDFGSTTVGTATAPTTFTVENQSRCSPTGRLAIVIGGADASQFMLGVDNCTGMILMPGGSCTVEGIYSPTAPATHAATIEATASPGGTAVAVISGSAASLCDPILLPGVQDFGSVVSGSSSSPVEFTFYNCSTSDYGVLTHSFGGPDAAEWSVVSSTCAGSTVAGGAFCFISVQFNAGTPGPKAARLDVTLVGGGGFPSAASLTAVSRCGITVTPTSHAFGAFPVGTASAPVTFTASNSCGTPTGALRVAIAGPAPADFPIVSGPGGDTCTGAVVPPGGTCTVDVQFSPTAPGLREATLSVSDASGPTAPVFLSGT